MAISFYTLPAGPDVCLIISEVVDGVIQAAEAGHRALPHHRAAAK